MLESLVSPVGILKRQVTSNEGECSLPSIRVCVLTRYGETIKTTRKVRLENQVFMASINEVEDVGKTETCLRQRVQEDMVSQGRDSREVSSKCSDKEDFSENEGHIEINEDIFSEDNTTINPEVGEIENRLNRVRNWNQDTQDLYEMETLSNRIYSEESLRNSGHCQGSESEMNVVLESDEVKRVGMESGASH